MDQLYKAKCHIVDRNKRKNHGLHMWEQQWMDTRKTGQLRKLFPISEEVFNTENTNIPIVNYYANMTWANRILLIKIWTSR